MGRYGDGSFPAEVGDNMGFTDSVPFSPRVAAISVRENQRIAEIGAGSNPHWHHATDLPSTYTEDDYRLGFNILSMICGAIGELSGAESVPCTGDATGDGTVDVTDLLAVLAEWNCQAACAADVTGDDRVDVSDLLAVLGDWGCR
jgi:hypothetical protein